jgi:hypothetical protein
MAGILRPADRRVHHDQIRSALAKTGVNAAMLSSEGGQA